MDNPDEAETQMPNLGPETPRGKQKQVVEDGASGDETKNEGPEEEKKEEDEVMEIVADLAVTGHDDPFIEAKASEAEEEQKDEGGKEGGEEEQPKETDMEVEEEETLDPDVSNDAEGQAMQETVFIRGLQMPDFPINWLILFCNGSFFPRCTRLMFSLLIMKCHYTFILGIFTYIYIYVHIYVYVRFSEYCAAFSLSYRIMHTYTHIHTHMHTYVRTYIHTYIQHTHTYVEMYICMYECAYTIKMLYIMVSYFIFNKYVLHIQYV